MTQRWWTSDLHLGHENILAHTHRPYGNIDDMDADLIERWNDRVDVEDEVYVLGDVAMGGISEMLKFVELLHGTKLLVPGNHDRCWEGLRTKKKNRVDQWRAEYAEAGFVLLGSQEEIRLGDHTVLVCHFPYHGDSREIERFVEFRPVDHGQWLIHGHVHEKWRQRERMINVGVDAWGGIPVAESELVELIETGPNDLPRIPWRR
ncbi:metallophosphoesterase family protein [Ferrimicrobium sp.]|uniref:metallophosphoesterase family protein n=1 Tax=Ferrimicrobium sp. TaxID=2926050 RepID=UPI0026155C32|nr:metallophosphoesterase family protein [Ferrimicrobium sp.]